MAGSNPEVADAASWQEKCLALQLELHRSRAQSTRVRDMLRDKVNFLCVKINAKNSLLLKISYTTNTKRFYELSIARWKHS